MRTPFVSAILSSMAVATSLSTTFEGPTYIPNNKVNRLSGQPQDGDYRMASCELHHSQILDTKLRGTPERNLNGTIYVQQQYLTNSGGWQIPEAYVNLQRLERGPDGTRDSEYTLYTNFYKDYEDLDCTPSPNPTYNTQSAALGARSTSKGYLALSTVDATIGNNFAQAD